MCGTLPQRHGLAVGMRSIFAAATGLGGAPDRRGGCGLPRECRPPSCQPIPGPGGPRGYAVLMQPRYICRGGFTPFGAQAISARRLRSTALPRECGVPPQECTPHSFSSCRKRMRRARWKKKALCVPISACGLIGGCDTGVLARWKFVGTMTLPVLSLGEMQGPGHSRMPCPSVSACAALARWERSAKRSEARQQPFVGADSISARPAPITTKGAAAKREATPSDTHPRKQHPRHQLAAETYLCSTHVRRTR
jgi:hypothetical protein